MRREYGFTLFEFIAVIVILAASGIAVFSFINFGTQVFVSGVERNQLSGSVRFASNRFSREMRAALPGTVTTTNSGRCIEFLPIKTAGQYISLARNSSQTMLLVTPVGGAPDIGESIWVSSNSDAIATVTEGDIDGTTEITLENGLTRGSRASRYYIVNDTTRYCVSGGDLLRNGILMAEGIYADFAVAPFFTVETPTLRRNGLVRVYWPFARGEERLIVDIEIPIKNVP